MTDLSKNMASYEIKIDLQGLIRLLAKNLYADADVFVREIIQNAHDSIKRRSVVEENPPLGNIHVLADRRRHTITFIDNGIGLTESEIHDYLSTIGRSGTGAFRQALITKGRQAEVSLIGQFGIGLLSAFVVAYKVEVETLSSEAGSQSWLWMSEGQSEYKLTPGNRHDIGTAVTLYISDNYLDVLLAETLHKAIKKYADFIPYQIFLNDQEAPTNAVNAPWHRTFSSERERLREYAAFVDQRFSDVALETIPLELKEPYRIDGVLYISDRVDVTRDAAGHLDVYQSRMFVTSNNREMLPTWATFIRGVIDSPAITLTASRDAIQNDAVAREIREALGELIVKHLQKMAESFPDRFERIMEWHSFHVKSMALGYDDFFDAIANLVPFETNRGLMNLREYCKQALRLENKAGYDVFYFSERSSSIQFYLLCDAKGLLVINASNAFDKNFLEKYVQHHPDVRLHQISGAGSEFLFERISAEEAANLRTLETDFRNSMLDMSSDVRLVHFKPTTIPAVTVLSSDAKLHEELESSRNSVYISQSMKDLLGQVLKEKRSAPFMLYLNADNPTIQQMAQMTQKYSSDRKAYKSAIQAICNNALLLASHLMTAEMAQAIFASSNQTIKLMIEQTEQLYEVQSKLNVAQLTLEQEKAQGASDLSDFNVQEELPKHIVCMVALPFRDTQSVAYESVLLPALRKVLELDPYYWQINRADEEYFSSTINHNVALWMKRAHAYIVDISEANPNVMMELGYMLWGQKERKPVIVLQSKEMNVELADLAGLIRISYPPLSGEHAVDDVAKALRSELAKNTSIQKLNATKGEHYLSPLFLKDWVSDDIANAIARTYISMERFVEADVEDVLRKFSTIRRRIIGPLQDEVAELLKELKSREHS